MKDTIKMNLGDPVRKKTLCVEVSPAGRDVSYFYNVTAQTNK